MKFCQTHTKNLKKKKKKTLLGRKAMTNLDSVLKSKDITLPTGIRIVKAMVFPVVMYGCESSTIKKAMCLITSVWSDSVQRYGLQPAKLLCPWDSLGKKTRVGCCALLQGIFWPRYWTRVSYISCIGRQVLYHMPPGKPKEGWALKKWCFQTVVLEKTPESPLDSKEIQPVHPKGNQPWIVIERTGPEAPILWPPDVKSRLIGRLWCWERLKERRVAEDKMVGWHYWFNGHGSEQTPGYSEGQGRVACCSKWGRKELGMT